MSQRTRFRDAANLATLSWVSPNEQARSIHHGDARAWLEANPAEPGMSVVTSLPDVSEKPGAAEAWGFEGWKAWFGAAVRQILRWTPEHSVAIFYQSDIRRGGVWVDKGYLVMRAAEQEGASLVWHKIVCRKPPGSIALGRASYSHMLCLTRGQRAAPRRPGPDVLADAGDMNWSRAMGSRAAVVACRFLLEETDARTVVDPYCGRGTVLAVANAMGLGAVGVELSAKRCRAARKLSFVS